AEFHSAFGHLLILKHRNCFHRNSTGKRASAVCGTMFTGFYGEHDLIVCKHGANRQHAAAQCLSKKKYVGSHVLMVAGQHAASPAETGLNLIRNEEHIRFFAEILCLSQITIFWYHNSCFTLYGFHQEACYV